jgi:hypothetical protein
MINVQFSEKLPSYGEIELPSSFSSIQQYSTSISTSLKSLHYITLHRLNTTSQSLNSTIHHFNHSLQQHIRSIITLLQQHSTSIIILFQQHVTPNITLLQQHSTSIIIYFNNTLPQSLHYFNNIYIYNYIYISPESVTSTTHNFYISICIQWHHFNNISSQWCLAMFGGRSRWSGCEMLWEVRSLL